MNQDNNVYDITNGGIVTSILLNDGFNPPAEVVGNIRDNPNRDYGTPILHLSSSETDSDSLYMQLNLDIRVLTSTLLINKKVLDNADLMNLIQRKANESGKPITIRIADEGYTLTQEDYNKLHFANRIAVDHCVESLQNDSKIIIQNEVFKYENQGDVQQVVERRENFTDMTTRTAFHINHKLSDAEFRELVEKVNSITDSTPSIELDYFEPEYYEEFLEGLSRNNINPNTHIQFIGYLLEDKSEVFRSLEKYPYEIDVVYSTCHDMVEKYTREPYTESRSYYSEIEGGGITSLENYGNVVENLEEFEREVKEQELSPLEIAVLAKMKIDEDFIYDPDHNEIGVDRWDNVNLSQLIHHDDGEHKRAVCLGFSTYYSALLRRNGVPMFRYETTAHSRNIGRIHDEKYGVDSIGIADPTWDLLSENEGVPSYEFFMLAPRDMMKHTNPVHEELTIGDTLALPLEEYDRIKEDTKIVGFYRISNGGDPIQYTARMLELMGVTPDDRIMNDPYEDIYTCCERGQLEGINPEVVMSAIENVMRKQGRSEEEIREYLNGVREKYANRATDFISSPRVHSTSEGYSYPVDVLTQDNVQKYHESYKNQEPRLYYNPQRAREFMRDWEKQHPVGGETNVEDPTKEVTPEEPTKEVTPEEPTIPQQEERQEVAEKITIYVDENNQSYINRYACTRFLAIPTGESIIIDGRVFFPVEREDAQAIIDAQEASAYPYFTEVLPFTLHPVKQNEEQGIEEEQITPEENTPEVVENNNQEEIIIDDPVTQELGEFSEDLIPGTDIHRPRRRGDYETDEEYVEFLRRFYQKYFPNAEYVQNVIHYCQENETNIYDYYQEVANGYRGENAENIPEFERENPFISEGDINLLLTSDDSMIDTHFANAMMEVIGLNISDFQRNKLSYMFDNPEDRYNEELARQYH